MTDQQIKTLYYATESLSCCAVIGPKDNPPEYQRAAARLVVGIGAHESGGWKYRRQVGFEDRETGGAFGLWQQQENFLTDCYGILKVHLSLRLAVDDWYVSRDVVHTPPFTGKPADVMGDDRRAIAYCRVYLLKRAQGRIPAGISAQAEYAARWYNRGPEQERYAERWAKDYRRYVLPCAEWLPWLGEGE